jgi:DNA-binding transcriptional regulator GbsR (MarR family)
MINQEEKKELIEMFGVHFEKHYNMSPLSSRILGLLIVDGCKAGMTFEELVTKLEASKSSVSTNLNLLLKIGRIEYYTLPGDRKKYFKAAPLSQRFNNYLSLLEDEKLITDRLMTYRKNHISCTAEARNLKHSIAYKEHILKVEALLMDTIEKFKEIENNN